MAPSVEIIGNSPAFVNNAAVLKDFHEKTLDVSAKDVSADSRRVVGEALLAQVNLIDHDVCDAGEEDSFFVADLGEVYRSVVLWKQHLPNVEPHFAVKSNPDPEVLKLLGSLGVKFDCASKKEIDMVLALGNDPSTIVYANPCKTTSFVRHAKEKNVQLTTVDNVHELHKIKKFHPGCGILLRIATDDESAQCRLSTKFGCTVGAALDELLPVCKELELNVVGVAFHVGSGAKDFTSISTAIQDSRAIFDRADEMGFSPSVLDIGGGFERETFEESSAVVRQALEQWFPHTYAEQHELRIIAEPGRLMVAKAFTLAAHVIARRDLSQDQFGMEAMIYINDGVYGNMNCILFDHHQPSAGVLTHKGKSFYEVDAGAENTSKTDEDTGKSRRYKFSIWGPTCDGLDCVALESSLAANVVVGDWLYFGNLGAYTSAASTTFNGLCGRANVIYVSSVPGILQ